MHHDGAGSIRCFNVFACRLLCRHKLRRTEGCPSSRPTMSMSSSTPRKNLSSHLIWSDAERDADATQKSALSSVQDAPYFFDGEGDDLLYGTLS